MEEYDSSRIVAIIDKNINAERTPRKRLKNYNVTRECIQSEPKIIIKK